MYLIPLTYFLSIKKEINKSEDSQLDLFIIILLLFDIDISPFVKMSELGFAVKVFLS